MGVFKQLNTQLQELIEKHGRDAVTAACVELLTCTCKRCGKEWSPRTTSTPEQCPRCKSKYWNVERGTV